MSTVSTSLTAHYDQIAFAAGYKPLFESGHGVYLLELDGNIHQVLEVYIILMPLVAGAQFHRILARLLEQLLRQCNALLIPPSRISHSKRHHDMHPSTIEVLISRPSNYFRLILCALWPYRVIAAGISSNGFSIVIHL